MQERTKELRFLVFGLLLLAAIFSPPDKQPAPAQDTAPPALEKGDSVPSPPPSPGSDVDLQPVERPPVTTEPPASTTEPAQDSRPVVRMYAPESCSICDALLSEIEKAGENALPFRLVKWPLMDWMEDGPWFYWKSDQSQNDWMRLHGLGKLNGKRLDFLLSEWLKTQPEAREVASQGQDVVKICCCKGTDTEACLCVEEIRKGIKRGPCTCNARFGSRHYTDANGSPTGPAGGYRELAVQLQPRASYCPNCRRDD